MVTRSNDAQSLMYADTIGTEPRTLFTTNHQCARMTDDGTVILTYSRTYQRTLAPSLWLAI